MAYNPFNIFRRNQRAIFAVITVVIMFMFVLSSGMSGKADFFNSLQDWVRGRSSKGDPLATLDGTKIYARDLEKARFDRVVASKFMQRASMDTVQALHKSLLDLSSQGSPEFTMFYQQALQSLAFQDFQGFFRTASMITGMKNDEKTKERLKPKDIDAMNTLEAMANLLRTGGNITQIPYQTDRGMIEFMLWQKKARQLGIRFNEEDAKNLVQKEFMGFLTSDVEARKALRDEYRDRYTDELLFKALAAEFEVRSAYTAVLGISPRGDQTLTSPLDYAPPYELFKFYQEKTSPTSYQALRVPVEPFIPLVQGTPTDDELQRLYKDREKYEPDPSKQEPGFYEPRKVKVEWLSVTGEEPYYKKAAADWMSLTEQLAKSEIRGLMVPFPGTSFAVVASHIAAPAAMKEPLVLEKYQRDIVSRHESRVRLGWTGTTSFVMPYDILETSTVKPQNLVAAAGGVAGGFGPGVVLKPINLLYSASVAAEQKARIRACMPIFMGSVPGPSLLPTMIGGEVAFRKNIPEPLPIEAYKPLILKEMSEEKARSLAEADLQKLKKSIDDLKETGKARETAARDLIADFIKTRGVKTGASTEFQSEFTIGDDPGLAPLKALKDKSLDGSDPHGFLSRMTGPVPFGRAFFWKSDSRSRSKEAALGLYNPEFYPERTPSKTDPIFLAWRTADQQSRGSSFTEAKPKVIEAWKRMKARDLAKAEAERLANEIRNLPPSETEFPILFAMRDMEAQLQAKSTTPKAKSLVKTFPIDDVAPYQVMKGFTGQDTVMPFNLAPSNDIPYPTPDMGKQLLDDRTKPMKTTFVLVDQPKDSYYVVSLLKRREAELPKFREQFYSRFMPSQVGSQITSIQRGTDRVKARDTAIALLKKEFKYEETEEQKKRLDDRQKNNFEE